MTMSTSRYLNQRDPLATMRGDLWAGIVNSQVAGLIMAVVMMLVFMLFLGTGPLYPVQVIGSFVYGDAALEGIHLGAVLAGLVLHQLGPSLFWGLVFLVAVHSLPAKGGGPMLAIGLGIGVLSQVVDVHLLLPALMTSLHGHDIWAENVPVSWSWAAHLVFGASLALLPRVRRWLAR